MRAAPDVVERSKLIGMPANAVVYLIHFERPYVVGRWSCQHYIGSTVVFDRRMYEHHNGNGAKLLALVNAAGITWEVVRTWDVPREGRYAAERALKQQRNHKRLCPACTP